LLAFVNSAERFEGLETLPIRLGVLADRFASRDLGAEPRNMPVAILDWIYPHESPPFSANAGRNPGFRPFRHFCLQQTR
jgi:hypothetical protein